jgi:hypothetical protein
LNVNILFLLDPIEAREWFPDIFQGAFRSGFDMANRFLAGEDITLILETSTNYGDITPEEIIRIETATTFRTLVEAFSAIHNVRLNVGYGAESHTGKLTPMTYASCFVFALVSFSSSGLGFVSRSHANQN